MLAGLTHRHTEYEDTIQAYLHNWMVTSFRDIERIRDEFKKYYDRYYERAEDIVRARSNPRSDPV